MHTLTSRPTKRLTRNQLFQHEQELVDKEANMIANELRVWLSQDDRLAIKCSKSPIEIPFYTELGRSIRNEYELWLEEHHITKIWIAANQQFESPAVDDHPCHPDNFSGLCIQRLWEILQ